MTIKDAFDFFRGFDAIKWLLAIGFGAAMVYGNILYETQSHAEATYVRKDVQTQIQNQNQASLDRIEKKLDRLFEQKTK